MNRTQTDLYNATATLVRETESARIIRVVPDEAKKIFLPGQYGSLGLASDADPSKLVKRAYSLSSSILDAVTGKLDEPDETDYYEFYFNKVAVKPEAREPLTPKLFALKNGDRLFCGRKITGHYTIERLPPKKNVLLVSTTTGEAPNNAIAAALLAEGRGVRITNVLLGDSRWRSLYAREHEAAEKKFDNYRTLFLFRNDAHAFLLEKLAAWCANAAEAEREIGFALRPQTAHVFLVGDPKMIGQPKKLGAWKYEPAKEGAIPTLTAHDFSIVTRFKEGDIDYESYW